MSRIASTRLDRAHLARALDDIARADRHLAAALAVCEAWESGYVASLLNRAADIGAYDDMLEPSLASFRERAVHAVDRAIEMANPRHHAAGLDDPPSMEAIQALYSLLTAQVRFHEAAIDIERRQWHRMSAPD